LYEDGLISIRFLEDIFSTEDLEGKLSTRKRSRQITNALIGWSNELEATRRFLLSLGMLGGLLLTALKLLGVS
jgi:hypothetical protein